MIEYLKSRFFFAGVQAELKSQYDDQQFINRVCQTDCAIKIIEGYWYQKRGDIYPTTMKYFIVCCDILSGRLKERDLPIKDLHTCADLLKTRLMQIAMSGTTQFTQKSRIIVWQQELEFFEKTENLSTSDHEGHMGSEPFDLFAECLQSFNAKIGALSPTDPTSLDCEHPSIPFQIKSGQFFGNEIAKSIRVIEKVRCQLMHFQYHSPAF